MTRHNTASSNTKKAIRKTHVRKRHWALGTAVILASSWITHTTTATIFMPEEQLAAQSQDLPATISSDSLTNGAADVIVDAAPQIAAVEAEPLYARAIKHTVKRGDTIGAIFKRQGFDLALPNVLADHSIAKRLVSLSIGKKTHFRLERCRSISAHRISTLSLAKAGGKY